MIHLDVEPVAERGTLGILEILRLSYGVAVVACLALGMVGTVALQEIRGDAVDLRAARRAIVHDTPASGNWEPLVLYVVGEDADANDFEAAINDGLSIGGQQPAVIVARPGGDLDVLTRAIYDAWYAAQSAGSRVLQVVDLR